MWRACLIVLALVAACTRFPELDDTVAPDTEDADYPKLIRLDGILAGATDTAQAEENADTTDALNARAEALRARAARLNRTVVDPDTKRRMNEGISEG